MRGAQRRGNLGVEVQLRIGWLAKCWFFGASLGVYVLISLSFIDITTIIDTLILVFSWASFMLFESYETKSFTEFSRRVLTSSVGLFVLGLQ